jgi:hypothetical protein
MKNSVLYLLIVLGFNTSISAQLFVKDNSYVYNKGSQVFVRNEVNLQGDVDANGATGNFYLRNEGQLLQGATTSSSSNTGAGKLSVYQEGTCNNYAYNYWCSPVGNASATVGNENFGATMLFLPTTNVTSIAPTLLATNIRDGVSGTGTLSIATRWIWKYIASNVYNLNGGGWQSVYSASTLAAGQGFTMKGVSGSDNTTIGEASAVNPGNNQRYDFRGKPNDGDISITVGNLAGADYTNQTLTGNPYPSAINLNLFLLENSGYVVDYGTGVVSTGGATNVINGNAYFWEHNKAMATSHLLTSYVGGYGVYVPNNVNALSPGTYNNATWNTYNADGTPNTAGASAGTGRYKRMFTPIGQGFMVEGTVASGTAVMKNKYRAFVKEDGANESHFEKNSTTATINSNWDEIQNVAGIDYTQFSRNEVPQIKIHTIINNQFSREVTMAFNPNTTDGFDVAMDAKNNENSLPNDSYFSFQNDTNAYVISTLPFDIDKRLPFTFKVATGQATFRVYVGDIINFDGSDEVFLYDGNTGIYHDIKNAYYDVTLDEGIHQNRYEITFKNAALSTNETSINNNLTVLQNNTNQILTIYNPNLMSIQSATIYDVAGKLIFNTNKIGENATYEYNTSALSEGIYFVKVSSSDNQNTTQKVRVERVSK